MVLEEIAERIEKETKIITDPIALLKILWSIKESNNFWEIVRITNEPYNMIAKAIEVFKEKGYVEFQGERIKLTEKGKKILEETGYGRGNYICDKCKGRTVLYEKLDIVKEFIEIAKNRPKAIMDYDQGYVTEETTLARIAFMDQRGDLRNKDLLILGDDDLMSVAAMLTRYPKRIAVFEIDQRIVNFIKKVAEDIGYDIEVYQHDLRKPLPDEFKGKFDTFFTDPTETLLGLKAFIGRGISALRSPRSAGYFGLTLVDSSFYKWRELQRVLVTEFNVVITDIIRDFSEYVNWEYIQQMSGWQKAPIKVTPNINWYTSTLYRIETLRGFRGFEETLEGDIYRDDEAASI